LNGTFAESSFYLDSSIDDASSCCGFFLKLCSMITMVFFERKQSTDIVSRVGGGGVLFSNTWLLYY
jgi:hypothetical protein